MVTFTQSMEQWLAKYHRDLLVPLMFGHTEVLTDELCREYAEWCLTEEGGQYLKGGSKYDENHRGNLASEEARRK